ncbi:MAG TPA: carbamate kinase [Acidobacteriota bacterium]|nr:carbamate kinase [Acidobacteriota bacterium]
MIADQPTAVVALGGNAISRKGEEDTIANQFLHTRESLSAIVPLVKRGFNLAITHGNGPQVGNVLLRVELARGKAPILPLGLCVADTEGGMGYMIAQSLQNRLLRDRIERPVATIVTQVIVDRNDPALADPSKYIGQFYTEEEAKRFAAERGWAVKKDGDRGWRRVAGSPVPRGIVEGPVIRAMVQDGTIVIAAGGGGIPVYVEDDGTYEGVDAVIDKDRASAVLGHAIGADTLIILTSVDRVAINFGTPDQKFLDRMSLAEARRYFAQGHFPAGSMGPKIEAAIQFLEGGGEVVIIGSIEQAAEALDGTAGTRILRD